MRLGKGRKRRLSFQVIGGMVVILLAFGVVLMMIGYYRLGFVLAKQYEEQYRAQAKATAETAAAMVQSIVDVDNLEQNMTDVNAFSDGSTAADETQQETEDAQIRIRFIYEPNPDGDFSSVDFRFPGDGQGSGAFEFHSPQKRSPDEETRKAIESLNADDSSSYAAQVDSQDSTLFLHVLRVTDSDGATKGYVSVKYTMQKDTVWLRNYIGWMLCATGILIAVSAFLVLLYFRRRLISPIQTLTHEAERFAEAPSPAQQTWAADCAHICELDTLATSLDHMEKDTLHYIDTLTAAATERERIRAELHVAGSIQSGLLPAKFPPFPEHTEFSIYASMQPAKEIGGDFYDFFLQDDDHLALVIADVSGKGIPAALFMAEAKVTIHVCTMNGGTPAEILTEANKRICENNPEDMFVTAWLGILELSTGRLVSANAGHEDPVLRRGGSYALHRTRRALVLGAMPQTQYTNEELLLQKGDILFLYTDGVTDAMNGEETMFGTDGLVSTLNGCTGDDPQALLKGVQDGVTRFTDGAPQFDDLTMLCLGFSGKASGGLLVPANKEELPRVTEYIDAILAEADCPPKAQMQIELAVEELFANVASYAYRDREGDVRIEAAVTDGCVTITFTDSGVPYNPLAKDDPDVTLSAAERPIGGLGIFLVKKNMDTVDYRYSNQQNCLTITKRLNKIR